MLEIEVIPGPVGRRQATTAIWELEIFGGRPVQTNSTTASVSNGFQTNILYIEDFIV